MQGIWRRIRNRGNRPTRVRLNSGLRAGLGLAILLGLLCGLTGRSQSPGPGGGGGQGQGQGIMRPHVSDISPMTVDDPDPSMFQKRMLALNIERQKQMVSDTDKLLKLARELNEEVGAQKMATLTSDEMHKVAEIEKLARNVRQRMTEGAGEPQSTMPPPAPIMFPPR